MAIQVANSKFASPIKSAAYIFVVDDEELVGQVVETILNLEGFEARFFSDPVEALREFLAADRKPDVLLSDYVMTPMNGMDLIALCKEAEPGLHTVLYSGNVGEEILRRYDFKPDAFLTKPFLPKALVGTVRKVLQQEDQEFSL
jgi:two-component system, chemotaxis family, chemotaxis protein CheY